MSHHHTYTVVDTHTAGGPTRIVMAGVPFIAGTMAEKQRHLQAEHDYVRRALMGEPRGHANMFGAIITPPVHPEAQLGVVFMNGGGYIGVCIHGSIGVITAALKMGLLPASGTDVEVVLDLPPGMVRGRATMRGSSVGPVAVENVASFLVCSEATVLVPSLGPVVADIAFGGSFIALVDAGQPGLDLALDQLAESVSKARAILAAVNEQVNLQHSGVSGTSRVAGVQLYREWNRAERGQRNLVVWGQHVDRSPCGVGLSARMAALHAQGRLGLGEPFVAESILGTRFTGRLLAENRVGERASVCPEISGCASITGYQQIVIEEDDPLPEGFLLPD